MRWSRCCVPAARPREGKCSALSAPRLLFRGRPPRTSDPFVHPSQHSARARGALLRFFWPAQGRKPPAGPAQGSRMPRAQRERCLSRAVEASSRQLHALNESAESRHALVRCPLLRLQTARPTPEPSASSCDAVRTCRGGRRTGGGRREKHPPRKTPPGRSPPGSHSFQRRCSPCSAEGRAGTSRIICRAGLTVASGNSSLGLLREQPALVHRKSRRRLPIVRPSSPSAMPYALGLQMAGACAPPRLRRWGDSFLLGVPNISSGVEVAGYIARTLF